MSHLPMQGYRYLSPAAIDPPYYYDDEDEYAGDYSESDALSDAPRLVHSPVTEIYRRKSIMNPLLEQYQQNRYASPNCYYYENVVPPRPATQQMRRPAVPTYRRPRIPMMDERTRYYSLGALQDRESLVHNSTQSANVRRPLLPPSSTAAATRLPLRRHLITVPTPRFYRRTASSNVYKKPSMLCLPLASQRDPAVYRRNRKIMEQNAGSAQSPIYNIERRQPVPATASTIAVSNTDMQNDNENEHQMTQSDVDEVLARYENILGDHVSESAQKTETVSSKSTIKSKRNKIKSCTANLKPKIPASIKQKLEKSQYTHTKPKSKFSIRSRNNNYNLINTEHLEVEEITTETLDHMLSEMMNSNCEQNNSENTNGKTNIGENEARTQDNFILGDCKQNLIDSGPKGDANQYPKSFNYDDISNNIDRSQEVYSKPPTPRIDDAELQCTSNIFEDVKSRLPAHCSRVSVESAMELHRSKSYIVNLIDRALSKELGTAVDKKTTSNLKEVDQRKARQTIDFLNKHIDKTDKELCLEITQALTDSAASNSSTARQCDTKHSIGCSCNVQEPQYVKQLKQLRWGHLRHIQREVRRLEDLERFLDSCSGEPFM